MPPIPVLAPTRPESAAHADALVAERVRERLRAAGIDPSRDADRAR